MSIYGQFYNSNALKLMMSYSQSKFLSTVQRHLLASYNRCQHNYYPPVQALISHQSIFQNSNRQILSELLWLSVAPGAYEPPKEKKSMKLTLLTRCHHISNPLLHIRKVLPCYLKSYRGCAWQNNNNGRRFTQTVMCS